MMGSTTQDSPSDESKQEEKTTSQTTTTNNANKTLKEALDLDKLMYMDLVPSQLMEIIVDAYRGLAATLIRRIVVKGGDKAPEFALADTATGKEIRLSKLRRKGPVVVCFYRGGWCAYCSAQLNHFQRYIQEINAKGATLVAISPQKQELAKETLDKHSLKFNLLNDVDNQISDKYGLTFDLEGPLEDAYKTLMLDIPKFNDTKDKWEFNGTKDKWELPIPATYVIDKDGKVLYSCVEAEPWKRPDPADIIAAIPERKKMTTGQWLKNLRRRFLVT